LLRLRLLSFLLLCLCLLLCLYLCFSTTTLQWAAFNEAYTAWAVSMGAIPSLSQTKGLQPGQASLPAHLTRERFLTPYYKSFVV
jgi:hypothetical protein